MAILKNSRHELFAQELAKGKSATEAYELAGYKPNRHNAANLGRSEHISTRLGELQGRIAERVIERTAVSRADILEELRKIALAPLDHDNVRPADKRAACMDYAKIEGWVIERQEIGGPGDFDRMTDDELRQYLASETSALGVGDDRDAPSGGAQTSRSPGRLN